jgi:hypothetical protein
VTTLNTLGSTDLDFDEVSDAALAMADFDAKKGDWATALEWLGVAALHRPLTHEYTAKRTAWQTAGAREADEPAGWG